MNGFSSTSIFGGTGNPKFVSVILKELPINGRKLLVIGKWKLYRFSRGYQQSQVASLMQDFQARSGLKSRGLKNDSKRCMHSTDSTRLICWNQVPDIQIHCGICQNEY